ncbi:superoxide dismutase [Streptomyces yokosukanensis]|uniref:Superoxide dismutase n=1 Tax=Streptomyces yokosukanensis TaxID=67386 RepID=A0A101P5K3_9ACTN|nr:superoxide dismutase [Streptomyces yokosukanensis]KUN05333.1 superoxide dismutase [Streptomyces yokosukanensis]
MVAAVYAGALAAALFATGSASTPGVSLETVGQFAPPSASATAKAVTYDKTLVPTGAWIRVRQHTQSNGVTTVQLRMVGVKPNHLFGAHVHQKACAADPAAAGSHYQDKAGMDAAHMSAQNEVWLDFKSDSHGTGMGAAQHNWSFRKGEAASVVIHSEPGTKGSRAACFTVPFGPTS